VINDNPNFQISSGVNFHRVIPVVIIRIYIVKIFNTIIFSSHFITLHFYDTIIRVSLPNIKSMLHILRETKNVLIFKYCALIFFPSKTKS